MVCKNRLFLLSILVALLSACMHDELRKDLFNVNTRVLALESELHDKQQTNSRQNISTSSRLNQMQEDLQKIRGDIDKLNVGVRTGELPGQGDQEPSLAKQMAELKELVKDYNPEKNAALEEKVDALEKTQIEILSLLEKLDKKKGDNKKTKLTSKTIEHAFHAKHFKEIVEDAPHILASKGLKHSESIRYYYSESLFRTGSIQEAAISFSELLKKDHLGDLEPKARLRMGDCFRSLGDKKTALSYYKLLIDKFPESKESELAKKHIKKLH